MPARTLMVQGTASSVGKSLIVAALCRIYARRGLRVAPFKSQNMSLNAAVTADGGEIGRAQAVQAQAAGIEPTVEMNPILIKPEGDRHAQIVVLGRSIGNMDATAYHEQKLPLRATIARCLASLRAQYDLIVIEGAGSPAEINLKEREIVNMHVARAADAPVVLVGDIDRGGVFAAFVGTLELLDATERERVAAFIVNKFRGDLALLQPGLDFLTERTGKPVLGVVPYVDRLRIADEDSLDLDDRMARRRPSEDEGHRLAVAVIRYPRISNHDDLLALEHDPTWRVRFVDDPQRVEPADLVILPGSKSTMADLAWLRARGFAPVLAQRVQRGQPILGVCGGCQMLGETLHDPDGVESDETAARGLGYLPLHTQFVADKVTAQVRAHATGPGFLTAGIAADEPLRGYEIHCGQMRRTAAAPTAFRIVGRGARTCEIDDGAVDASGTVVGTMIHGLFDNAAVRSALAQALARGRRQTGFVAPRPSDADDEYNRLADVVEAALDMERLDRLTGCSRDAGQA
ncbi:MAG: cobyric acid synthase [Myxococcales bacterium FL481]|nr:MAG: cobyric acid synthase [Myxococcales bacterium FL481]